MLRHCQWCLRTQHIFSLHDLSSFYFHSSFFLFLYLKRPVFWYIPALSPSISHEKCPHSLQVFLRLQTTCSRRSLTRTTYPINKWNQKGAWERLILNKWNQIGAWERLTERLIPNKWNQRGARERLTRTTHPRQSKPEGRVERSLAPNLSSTTCQRAPFILLASVDEHLRRRATREFHPSRNYAKMDDEFSESSFKMASRSDIRKLW